MAQLLREVQGTTPAIPISNNSFSKKQVRGSGLSIASIASASIAKERLAAKDKRRSIASIASASISKERLAAKDNAVEPGPEVRVEAHSHHSQPTMNSAVVAGKVATTVMCDSSHAKATGEGSKIRQAASPSLTSAPLRPAVISKEMSNRPKSTKEHFTRIGQKQQQRRSMTSIERYAARQEFLRSKQASSKRTKRASANSPASTLPKPGVHTGAGSAGHPTTPLKSGPIAPQHDGQPAHVSLSFQGKAHNPCLTCAADIPVYRCVCMSMRTPLFVRCMHECGRLYLFVHSCFPQVCLGP